MVYEFTDFMALKKPTFATPNGEIPNTKIPKPKLLCSPDRRGFFESGIWNLEFEYLGFGI
jgi:hypothetical protein